MKIDEQGNAVPGAPQPVTIGLSAMRMMRTIWFNQPDGTNQFVAEPISA